ncbi:hypothetical protein BBJ28_00023636 [Nothophytophthora sp. Chile5]|nr:hypothetical protein BBJ28_00023636 [Nothophytophthora sp. Chile5]
MRVIVGSTITPHLLVAHLDISERNEWTASLSGELCKPACASLYAHQELPSTHVCRGLYLAEKSPFVHVASTEKRKRATFFHAAANDAPQPVYLSRYKVPRRARPPITEAEANGAAEGADKTSKSSIAAAEDDSSGKGLLELILANMTAMQTQLNARFDAVDKKLAQLVTRVELLERK